MPTVMVMATETIPQDDADAFPSDATIGLTKMVMATVIIQQASSQTNSLRIQRNTSADGDGLGDNQSGTEADPSLNDAE